MSSMSANEITTQGNGLEEITRIKRHMEVLRELMSSILKDGTDYGIIPKTNKQKVLLKPGAEKIITAFAIRPRETIEQIDLGGGHREYRTTIHFEDSSGRYLGFGVGSCSTMESKYRYRNGSRKCPECGADAIIKGKVEYGGGYICYSSKGGCGAKYPAGDAAIEGQAVGRTENQDIADVYNTCLKISKKRSLVDGVLTVTNCSDSFTQDLDEEMEPGGGSGQPPKQQPRAQKPQPEVKKPESRPMASIDALAKKIKSAHSKSELTALTTEWNGGFEKVAPEKKESLKGLHQQGLTLIDEAANNLDKHARHYETLAELKRNIATAAGDVTALRTLGDEWMTLQGKMPHEIHEIGKQVLIKSSGVDPDTGELISPVGDQLPANTSQDVIQEGDIIPVRYFSSTTEKKQAMLAPGLEPVNTREKDAQGKDIWRAMKVGSR